MITRDGITYVDTAEAAQQLGPDVTEEMIRDWVKRKILTPVGRITGRSNIFRLLDVAQAERMTRTERRGRPRRVAMLHRDRELMHNLPRPS